MSRDNFTCQHCGSTDKQLHIHHKYYEYGVEIWQYKNDALITLCKKCHEKEQMFYSHLKYDINKFLSTQKSSITLLKILTSLECNDKKAYLEEFKSFNNGRK